MANANQSPLTTAADFDHAMTEAERILEEPREETIEDRYFNQLLGNIADYHDAQPPAAREGNLERLQDLDRQLKSFGKAWPKPHGVDGDQHWSPLLGGDVDPTHQAK